MTAKEIFERIINSLKYTFFFAFQTGLAVVWYVICRGAALVIASIDDCLKIEGGKASYICEMLALLFTVMGAVIAVVYFVIESSKLIREIWNKSHEGKIDNE